MTMPRSTQVLAVTATGLTALWAWAWLGLTWTLALPTIPQRAVMTTSLPSSPATSPEGTLTPTIDSGAFLEQPAFYPDRRMHPYRPGAEVEAAALKTTLDFELTTTVVTARRAFAVLRLRGGGSRVIARPGEPFEADPAWQVTRIDRTSASFVNAQGTPLTLTIKPPAPATQTSTQAPMIAAAAATNTSTSPLSQPTQAPVTAVRPMQENAEVRARIEARRREAQASAQSARTQ